MNLDTLGWNSFFETHFEAYKSSGLIPARVCNEQKNLFQVYSEAGELAAEVSGKMLYTALSRSDLPVVGDWVTLQFQPDGGHSIIHAVLPRTTGFSRKVASGSERRSGGVTDEQLLASNVNTIFLVSGLDREFNLRRIERYLTLVYNSGASPVIVLNKADLCDDNIDTCLFEVESIAYGVPVCVLSAVNKQGLDALEVYLQPGKTVVFLGSSGVGKSTLINALLGYERQRVTAISAHVNKGQHTTTSRELILLPTGGLLIDTPGMRELQLWGDESNLHRSFEDVEELALQCRFSDCEHQSEPGCAVKEAIEAGELDPGRFQNYLKLKREFVYLEKRQTESADYIEKKKWKQIMKAHRFNAKQARFLKGND
jgi:ribosome biogenesis GTPase